MSSEQKSSSLRVAGLAPRWRVFEALDDAAARERLIAELHGRARRRPPRDTWAGVLSFVSGERGR